MSLPDAEQLYAALLDKLRPSVTRDTGIVGIATGGAWLAERLHRELGVATPLGVLDASFYRDDFSQKGLKRGVKPAQIPFDVEGRHVLVVDDVLYSGRTVGAALRELADLGRPARVELAVLVDRGHHELPIRADHVGAAVETTRAQSVRVLLAETGDADGVVLLEREQTS